MEDIEYKGFNINISDYSVIVTYDGVIMGQFDTESEAKAYIDSIDRTDPEDPEEFNRLPTAKELEDDTDLKIVHCYGNVYREVSGKDPDYVRDVIQDYNERHGSLVSCYYDNSKYAVFIML